MKSQLATQHPYRSWLDRTQLILEDLKPVEPRALRRDVSLLNRQQAFGYTTEDTRILMSPMATTGQEAIGSMGTDTPISAMSDKSKLLYTYFKQNFAQVTNPPIDPIREELVMSLVSFIGPRPNILDHTGMANAKRLEVRQPILTNGDLEKIRSIGHTEDRFDTKTLDFTYDVERGAEGMPDMLDRLCERAEAAVKGGYNIIVLSDRQIGPDRIAIPALLATAAVHHHLIRKGLRTSVGLVVETGEPREVHHFCLLAGYGAEAINPYLAFDTLLDMHAKGEFPKEVDASEIVYRYIKAVGKGILKVMSKMGISTYQSYCGAQIFDAIGLSRNSRQVFLRHRNDDRRRRAGRDRHGNRCSPYGRLRPRPVACKHARHWRRICLSHAWRKPCLDAGRCCSPSACRSRQCRGSLPRILRNGEHHGAAHEHHPRPVQGQERR
ncbi:hypothetical protein AJ87_27960 [Rhizobium yanglingense]|nr:hypothetical protein AJ87_27960 [Rhizobium yanglingense]